jgi:ubiquinone biosynthesis protein
VLAVIAGAGIIGSSLIGALASEGPSILGVNVISVIGFSLSTVLGLWLVWGVVRSGRI